MLPYLIAGAIGFVVGKLLEEEEAPKYADGGSVNTNDLKVGDIILYKTFYPITFETDYKQTIGSAYGKIVRISQYGNKSFIVQPNSRFKIEKVVQRKNVLGIGTEADMFLTS